MRLPRDVSGADLARRLARLGYTESRQSGSHRRLSAMTPRGEHHVTVPLHDHLRVGTLAAILSEVERSHDLTRDALLALLFD
ncbi:MAG: type II toxin-antitoxin system HicA family toxin [Vicinamibacteria bacterium]